MSEEIKVVNIEKQEVKDDKQITATRRAPPDKSAISGQDDATFQGHSSAHSHQAFITPQLPSIILASLVDQPKYT